MIKTTFFPRKWGSINAKLMPWITSCDPLCFNSIISFSSSSCLSSTYIFVPPIWRISSAGAVFGCKPGSGCMNITWSLQQEVNTFCKQRMLVLMCFLLGLKRIHIWIYSTSGAYFNTRRWQELCSQTLCSFKGNDWHTHTGMFRIWKYY